EATPAWARYLTSRTPPLSPGSAAAELGEIRAVDLHVRVVPVAVRLALEGRLELLVEGRGEALGVADHVRERDAEPAAEPLDELERAVELRRPAQDVLVGEADVFDPDR